MSETQPASSGFDRNRNITLNLKRDGKSVVVRFPSDDELAKRERRMRTFYRKGSALPEFEHLEEANFELATAIRVSGDEIDESIANRIVEAVLKAIPDQPVRGDKGYHIPITIGKDRQTGENIQTLHVLREPSEKEVRKYRESAIWMGDMRFGRQEAKTMLSAVGNFYDKLFVSAEGYVSKESIPVTHKSVAVNALLTQIKEEQELDEIDPEGF